MQNTESAREEYEGRCNIGADSTTSLLGTGHPLPSLVHDVQAKVWLRSDPGKMIQTKHVCKSLCGSGLNVFPASIETANFSRFHVTQNTGVLCINPCPEFATYI